MAECPEVRDLIQQLSSLVHWENFAINLKGIKHHEIEIIKKENSKVDEQKRALFNKWLSLCPDASWFDVISALDRAQEITLAEKVRRRCNCKQEPRQDNPISHEIKFSSDEEDTIISELEDLHFFYTRLFTDTREHIEELVESNKLSLHKLAAKIEDAQIISFRSHCRCKSIAEIFDVIRDHCNFLDSSVLKMVIQLTIGESDLLKRAEEHFTVVRAFKKKQPIKVFRNKLEGFTSHNYMYHTRVIIKLTNPWGKVQIALIENLVKMLLNYEGELLWVSVESGSIQLTILVSKVNENLYISNSSQQVQFMHFIGIIFLQIGTIKVLMETESRNSSFESGLLEASKAGHNEAVQVLLQLGVNVDYTNNKGKTALMLASKNGYEGIAELLLSAGAKVNIQDNIGQTAVMLAKTKDMFQMLVRNNADVNIATHKGSTALYISCFKGHSEVAEHLFFDSKVDHHYVRPDGVTLLMAASEGGIYKIVKVLLQEGNNPNIQDSDGVSAMHLASFNGHYTVMELLLNNNNANPNLSDNNGWTPLMNACSEGHYKIVQLLLNNGADPNVSNSKNGMTALIQACLSGHNGIVQLLLTVGADPNTQDDGGYTPIQIASLKGCFTITELLLKNHADPSLPDNDGWTPLMNASQEGHNNIVQLLLEWGVAPNVIG